MVNRLKKMILYGNHTYLSIKGSFKWGKILKPEYVWFNGTAEHYLIGRYSNRSIKTFENSIL